MDYKKLFKVFEDGWQADGEEDQSVGEYIAERFEEVKTTQQLLNKLGEERLELETKHKSSMASINKAIQNVQASCTHPLTTYLRPTAECVPYTRCEVCGLQISHEIRGYDG